jgi:hypothetical protein
MLFADIIYTIQVLRAQRQRCAELQVSRLPPLPCDFTWIVGNADSLTTMDRCQFQVITDRLLCLVSCCTVTCITIATAGPDHSFVRAHRVPRRALLRVQVEGQRGRRRGRVHSVDREEPAVSREHCEANCST